ncbi:CoxG family protein [Variovorax paradoxus]|uniref:CoxG family protein n=1 Tax=Variovorax paradoxus TaxID=34073 RepID=UPI003D647D50
MELTGHQVIPASLQRTWQALNDPQTLKACITGCESIEATAPNTYAVTMTAKVGPISARFKGRLHLSDIQPPTSYKILFEGQGGIAGFGKGTATVQLSPQGTETGLEYRANAQVGGKIAQIGSRLVDASARKIADDFFTAFNKRLSEDSGNAEEVPYAALNPHEIEAENRGWIRRLLDIFGRDRSREPQVNK